MRYVYLAFTFSLIAFMQSLRCMDMDWLYICIILVVLGIIEWEEVETNSRVINSSVTYKSYPRS